MSDRPLTILLLLPALEGGGVERGVVDIAGALVRRGHRAIVASAGGRLVAEIERAGASAAQLPLGVKSPRALGCLPALRSLMLREKVDIVDAHSRLPAWIGRIALGTVPASQRPGWITTVQGLHRVSRYSEIMCGGERVIVVSRAMRDHVLNCYPRLDARRIRVIPRGIDPAEFFPVDRPDEQWRRKFLAEFGIPDGRRLVSLVGRVTRLKGHADLFQLIQGLRSRGIDAHGLIVGGCHPSKTGYVNELHAQVRDRGLTEHITFTGPRSDLREIYALSAAVVSLSQTPESFGLTVAEALAVGTPVLGYDHGGVSEILEAEFPRGAVPFGDIPALIDRASEILSSPARPHIAPNQFDKQAMLSATIDVYEELAAARVTRQAQGRSARKTA